MTGPINQDVKDGNKRLSDDLQEGFGYITKDDVNLIRRLVSKIPENGIAVNIGAGVGTSVIAMLEERNDITVYSIDIVNDIQPTGGLGNEREILERYGFSHLLSRRREIHGDSKVVGKNFEKKIDLLFVDGDHSYEGCKGDLEVWLPHMNKNGYVLIHDYTHVPWVQVMKATDEVMVNQEIVGQTDNTIAFRYNPITRAIATHEPKKTEVKIERPNSRRGRSKKVG